MFAVVQRLVGCDLIADSLVTLLPVCVSTVTTLHELCGAAFLGEQCMRSEQQAA